MPTTATAAAAIAITPATPELTGYPPDGKAEEDLVRGAVVVEVLLPRHLADLNLESRVRAERRRRQTEVPEGDRGRLPRCDRGDGLFLRQDGLAEDGHRERHGNLRLLEVAGVREGDLEREVRPYVHSRRGRGGELFRAGTRHGLGAHELAPVQAGHLAARWSWTSGARGRAERGGADHLGVRDDLRRRRDHAFHADALQRLRRRQMEEVRPDDVAGGQQLGLPGEQRPPNRSSSSSPPGRECSRARSSRSHAAGTWPAPAWCAVWSGPGGRRRNASS